MPRISQKWSSRIELLSYILIAWSCITLALETEPEMAPYKWIFDISEIFVIAFFTVEYILRLTWAKNKWKYITSFHGIIDLLAILPTLISFGTADLRTMRLCRFFRILRVAKLHRYNKALNSLVQAFRDVKAELFVTFVVSLIILYLASMGIYHFEKDVQPEVFGSISKCIWWAGVSLTTVGYGDAYPITIFGRLFTGGILFVGIGIVSLPPALIGSAMVGRHLKNSKEATKEQYCTPCDKCVT